MRDLIYPAQMKFSVKEGKEKKEKKSKSLPLDAVNSHVSGMRPGAVAEEPVRLLRLGQTPERRYKMRVDECGPAEGAYDVEEDSHSKMMSDHKP